MRDTKIKNAAIFEIRCEDHTIGEPLVSQLHEDDRVTFAACKVPHPLEYRLQIKVRTADDPTKTQAYTPANAYNNAVEGLVGLFSHIQEEFKLKVKEACSGDPCLDFDPAAKHRIEESEYQGDYYQDAPDADMAEDEGYGAAR